jgi:hypothetical protein
MNKLNAIKKTAIIILFLFLFTSCDFNYSDMIGVYIKIDNDVKEIL